MRKSKTWKAAAVGALLVGLAIPASADLLSIPAMIPDVCVFGHCVQFTHTAALAHIQTVIGQIQQLKNEAEMLAHLPMAPSAAAGDVQAILAAEQNVAADIKADTAAKAIANQDQTDVAEAARLQSLAQQATGSVSQAQVANGIALQQLSVEQKQLELQTARQTQDAAMRSDVAHGLGTLAQPYTGPAPGQGGW